MILKLHRDFDNPKDMPITETDYNIEEASWTIGLAWGIYGFVLSYKYTKDSAYLNTEKIII